MLAMDSQQEGIKKRAETLDDAPCYKLLINKINRDKKRGDGVLTVFKDTRWNRFKSSSHWQEEDEDLYSCYHEYKKPEYEYRLRKDKTGILNISENGFDIAGPTDCGDAIDVWHSKYWYDFWTKGKEEK